MSEKIRNPLPEPVVRPHRQLEFDITDQMIADLELGGEKGIIEIMEDDFDIRISEDDDFDLP